MSQTSAVSCHVCGKKVSISPDAFTDVAKLERELPDGWLIDQTHDPESGGRTVIVRCPDHRRKE